MKIKSGDIVRFKSQFNNQSKSRLGLVIGDRAVGKNVFKFYLIMGKDGDTEWVKSENVKKIKSTR